MPITLLDGTEIRGNPGRIPKSKKPKPRSERPQGRTPTKVVPMETYSPGQILDIKVRILELFEAGTVKTLTEAAEILGIPATRVHRWAQNDSDFKELVGLANEIIADQIEKQFVEGRNDIPKMMILKGIRPKYRDNAHLTTPNAALDRLLDELKNASKPKELPSPSGDIIDVTSTELSVVDVKTGNGEVNEPMAKTTSEGESERG